MMLVNAFHGLAVGIGARLIGSLFRSPVKRADGCHVAAIPVVTGMKFLGSSDLRLALPDDLVIRLVPQLMPVTHGQSPARHGAVRISDGDLRELLLRLLIPERMQQRYPTLEGLLHADHTGDGEMHRAQLFSRQVF